MRLLAYGNPVFLGVDRSTSRCVQRRGFSAQLAARRRNGGTSAGEAQPELAVVPEGGRNRQGLAAPFVQPGNGFSFIHGKHQRLFGYRFRQDFQRHLRQQAERPEAAGKQARHIVTGDVFHHLATKIEHLPGTVDQLDAEDKIPHGTGLLPPWPSQTGGDAAAHRSASGANTRASGAHIRTSGASTCTSRASTCAGKLRRLESQHLAFFGQHGLQLGQRRAALCRDVEFSRLIGNDAAVAGHIKHLASQHAAVEILAASATDAQLRLAGMRRLDGADEIVEPHQKRSSSGNLVSP